MLIREKQSIIDAISRSWNTVSLAIREENTELANKAVSPFITDPRVSALADCLTEMGVVNAVAIAKLFVTNDFSGYYGTRPTYGSYGLYAERAAAPKATTSTPTTEFSTDMSYSELEIALNLCNKKWDKLQVSVYGLIADLGTAKTYEACRMAVRTFTLALT